MCIMYRDNSILSKSVTKKDFSNKLHRVCKVDQFNSQPFNKGNFGWSRNTISAMVHAVNYQEFLSIAQAVAQNPRQFNLPAKCSFKDALALCRPRMCQSPYELDLFAKQLADNDMVKLSELYMKNITSTDKVSNDVETKIESNEK